MAWGASRGQHCAKDDRLDFLNATSRRKLRFLIVAGFRKDGEASCFTTKIAVSRQRDDRAGKWVRAVEVTHTIKALCVTIQAENLRKRNNTCKYNISDQKCPDASMLVITTIATNATDISAAAGNPVSERGLSTMAVGTSVTPWAESA